MTRVAWLTDVHLNFLGETARKRFYATVAETGADAILLGGDVSEATDLVEMLEGLADSLSRPIYFVLGNHDFYHSSIREVRTRIDRLTERLPWLVYLSHTGVKELAPQVGLVGHDGWADARLGDYERSLVEMNDNRLIAELAAHGKRERWNVLKSLADEAAAHLDHVLPKALADYEQVIVLTHVPPFREACWHEGRISDDQWLPHFTSKAVGDAILEAAADFPHRQLTVLCGHTHGAGECRPRDNVHVLTGGALYGEPAVQRVFEFE